MIALPRRWCGVTRSELVTDHLPEDGGEVVADFGLQGWGEATPDGGGAGRHGTSQCSARVTSSDTAAKVSLVGGAGRGGARVVAATGSRKVIASR